MFEYKPFLAFNFLQLRPPPTLGVTVDGIFLRLRKNISERLFFARFLYTKLLAAFFVLKV
jgi:hypothetical protein